MTLINLKYVLRQLGLLILLMSCSMTISLGWAIYEYLSHSSVWRSGSEVVQAFGLSIFVGVLFGGILCAIGRGAPGHLGKKESLLIVSSSWFLGAAIACMPFWFWAKLHTFSANQDTAFLSFVSCYFEAMSGLTTTGATVLANIESIPLALLFWRAFTHWLGGLGIVVIFVAVLPALTGGSGKKLFRIESTGISNQGITPHIKESARFLLNFYIGLTLLEIVALKLVDPQLTWFSAITHTFSTLATGGYSNLNASAGGLSAGVQWILIIFMVLAGVNFGLYQQLFHGRFHEVVRSSELKCYLLILSLAAGTIALFIFNTPYEDTTGQTSDSYVRDAIFQTVSIQTTTGFASVNFEQWGLVPKAILIGLMFIGGCGGSTGGGIKVIRILSALKIMWLELERSFRPSVIRPVRIGGHMVDFHQRISVLSYVLGILVLFGMGSALLMVTEDPSKIDGTTALTASIASVNNIGPGLSRVGAIENYAWFSDLGKLILCVLMAVGRLEVFAVLVVFMPRFWKSH